MKSKPLPPTSPRSSIAPDRRSFRLLFARPATAEEMKFARQFLANPGKGGPEGAWRDLAHVLLCSNEFIYVD